MIPEDTAEQLARGMVRDADPPRRNLRPPDAGAVAKLRGAVVRARWEGRQDELLEVLGACQEYLNQDPPDVDGFLVSVYARGSELGVLSSEPAGTTEEGRDAPA